MSPMRLLLSLALVLPGSVMADPKTELATAFDRLMSAPAFRATMSNADSGEVYMEMEYLAPDRYRLVNKQGGPTMVVIGNQASMDIDGQRMNVPIPVDNIVKAYRDSENWQRSRASMTVESAGAAQVDGQPARQYRYRMTHPQPMSAMAWVGAGGQLLQVEMDDASGRNGKVRIRYRDIGATNIRIP